MESTITIGSSRLFNRVAEWSDGNETSSRLGSDDQREQHTAATQRRARLTADRSRPHTHAHTRARARSSLFFFYRCVLKLEHLSQKCAPGCLSKRRGAVGVSRQGSLPVLLVPSVSQRETPRSCGNAFCIKIQLSVSLAALGRFLSVSSSPRAIWSSVIGVCAFSLSLETVCLSLFLSHTHTHTHKLSLSV